MNEIDNSMFYQKIFNKVVQHLHDQGEPSIENGVCKYRGPNNTKCAIGALIPDSSYDPKMEGRGITKHVMSSLKHLFTDDNCNDDSKYFYTYDSNKHFLSLLQTAHDMWANGGELKWELEEIANDYRLDKTILEILNDDTN